MDDNDLDVAASMIAGLNIKREGDGADANNSRGYQFDDPLGDGRFGKFDDDGNSSSSDEESQETDNTGDSGGAAGDGTAPPVMDLFAGNFDIPDQNNDQEATKGFGNFDNAFANFDDAFAGTDGESIDAGSGFPIAPNSDSADVFGERGDYVGLLDMEEPPEKHIDDDDGSHSSASSDEEQAKP